MGARFCRPSAFCARCCTPISLDFEAFGRSDGAAVDALQAELESWGWPIHDRDDERYTRWNIWGYLYEARLFAFKSDGMKNYEARLGTWKFVEYEGGPMRCF